MAWVGVTVGVVVVVDVERGGAANAGPRSQGFGGDACMSREQEEGSSGRCRSSKHNHIRFVTFTLGK